MRWLKSRPSPALVISVLALVAALAGTAVAGDPIATTSKVSKKKVKRIAKRKAKKQINKTLPIGSAELAAIEEKFVTFTIGPNSSQVATVTCDDDQRVLSGGWQWDAPASLDLRTQADHRGVFQDSLGEITEGWRAVGRNNTAQPHSFTVFAYCLTSDA